MHCTQRRRGLAVAPAIYLAGVLTICATGCGRGDADSNTAAAASNEANTGAAAAIPTQQLASDPCALVPRATVEELLGPFTKEPARVTSNETQTPDPEGEACVYEMTKTGAGARHFVALQVDPDAANIELPSPVAPSELDSAMPGVEARAKGNSLVDGRWDAVNAGLFGFTASRGRFSVFVSAGGTEQKKALQLAGLIYDQISELPFRAEPDDTPAPPPERDACALLEREEAEAVLGPLVVPPYASRGGSALAAANGWSCAYYTSGHRALVLTPTWGNGKIDFKMASAMGQMLWRAAGGGGEAPDTLDGPWDQVNRGYDGSLQILAGDRILAVDYTSSATDLAGAVKLARLAAVRLSGAGEP